MAKRKRRTFTPEFKIDESYTSQTCPKCGNQKKLTIATIPVNVVSNITATVSVRSISEESIWGTSVSPQWRKWVLPA